MLETELRDLFERQAAAHQPPSSFSIPAVNRRARARLRVRRVGVIATPLLAASAVMAIVAILLPSPVPTGHRGPIHPAASLPAPVPTAPAFFDPLRPYASFGWLPAGMAVLSDSSGTTYQYVEVSRPNQGSWTLAVYTAGQCSFVAMGLRCAGLGPQFEPTLTQSGPAINGRTAYWTFGQGGYGILVFEYARGGWAKLIFRERAYALRVAEHITFGVAAAPPRFPVQLIGMPGWQLRYATSNPSRGGYLAGAFGFARGSALRAFGPGAPRNYPDIYVSKTGQGGPCYFTPGQSAQTVVAGYPVTVTRVPDDHGVAVQELCAVKADGLSVDIFVTGNHPAADVTSVFAHLRLLGPDPARWTTRPAG